MRNYKEKECTECDETFKPRSSQSLYCDECRIIVNKEKEKVRQKRYDKTNKGKARAKKYHSTDKCKAIVKKSQSTDKYKGYAKSINGLLSIRFTGMSRRVMGMDPKSMSYIGKEIMDRDVFYEWSLNDENYLRLHENWVEHNYENKLSPSIDRISNDKGYTLDNVQWISWGDHCKKTGIDNRINK